MRSSLAVVLSGLLASASATAEAADAKAKITFQDQVSTIFKNRCNSCHNADKQKGGLTLETFGGAMQGGGSGKVVEPGDVEGSTLYQLITHQEQPNMPPNSPKIPDAEIEVIRLWIEAGAPETSGSAAVVKAKPKFEFKLDPDAAGKPVGPPAMPEAVSTEPVVVTPRPTAIIALASSPWAPLVAVGGHKQVLLYRTTDNHLVGVLPFPEGTIHVLKFSRNGALLLAGGGRGGQSGLAVAWDVKTGKRVFEIGKEYDAVLAADISSDHGLVALGGPSKVLRVYNTADGQLVYEQRKHTEWLTALEFSPDGVLLASGDRNNGLLVWEATTGREFYDLRGHNLAITDISWRLDSNVVASSSEDGTVRLWEMESGKAIKTISAHGGGVASVRFAKDGRLVTTGRDRLTRLWNPSGAKQRDFEAFKDLALEAVFTHDGSAVIAGDWSGELRVWDAKTGKTSARLAANPAPLAARLAQANQALAEAEKTVERFAGLVKAPAEKAAALDLARRTHAEAQAEAARKKGAAGTAQQVLERKSAAETAAVAALAALRSQRQNTRNEAERAAAELTAEVKAATDRLAAADAAVDAARAEVTRQEHSIASVLDALKAAKSRADRQRILAEFETKAKPSAASRSELELATLRQKAARLVLDQTSDERTRAVAALESATRTSAAEAAALEAAQAAVQKATEAKKTAEKALAEAKATAQAAARAVAARKAELDRRSAEKAAADKALAASKPAIEAAEARAKALRSERDALALEKKHQDAYRAAVAAQSDKSS